MDYFTGHASASKIYAIFLKNHHKLKPSEVAKTIPDYEAFPLTCKRIGKTRAGMSIKRRYLRRFVAKRPYLDGSLC